METQEIELGVLTEKEKRLIFAIRNKYRYGRLQVVTKDGQPFRLVVAERFEDLSNSELSTFEGTLQT